MDRRLLIIAGCFLVLELVLFLGAVGVIPLSPWSSKHASLEQEKLGEIQTARRNVRRRGVDSNIWEDSATKDFVYENDSLLTLSDSSAKLKLRGNLNLELQENTLVVLEANEGEGDKPFRLRFSRGDVRTKNGSGGLKVLSGEWVVTATPGADISMRAVDSQRVEVEVHSGDVHVAHSVHGQVRELTHDQKLTLFPEEAGEVVTASRSLTWIDARPQKIYAHEFPVKAKFKWVGSGERLEVLAPGKGTETYKLKNAAEELELSLQPGSHHLTLKSATQTSRTLDLQVMRAPKIIHLTPLPRNRVKTDTPTLFAWLSEVKAGSYRLELATDEGFKNIVHAATTKDLRTETRIPFTGNLFWHVIAIDEDGFVIPAAYSYPLITHPDPLAPPKLRTPTSQPPDDARKSAQRPSLARVLWNYLVPQAHGDTVKHLPPVIFNWDAVEGADFYIIEISPSSDFSSPEVIAKTSTNTYAWGRFTKKIYYYRVAGGTKDGRVGYFSEPERVDLTNWPPPKIKRETQSEKVVATTPRVTTEPPPAPASVSPSTRTVVESTPTNIKFCGKIWWQGAYTILQESGPQSTKSSRSGSTPLGLGLELSGPTGRGRWHAELRGAQFTWQPKSETTWPYQPGQQSLQWNAGVFYSGDATGFRFGLVAEQSPVINRQDLEEVSLDEEISYGLAAGGTFKRDHSTHAHMLGVTYSSAVVRVSARNNFRWFVTDKYFVGADGDITYGFGAERSLTNFDLAIQLGASW